MRRMSCCVVVWVQHPAKQVACGYSHTAVLTQAGEVWTWYVLLSDSQPHVSQLIFQLVFVMVLLVAVVVVISSC